MGGGRGGVIYFVGVGKGNRFWYSRKIIIYQITHGNFLVNGLDKNVFFNRKINNDFDRHIKVESD